MGDELDDDLDENAGLGDDPELDQEELGLDEEELGLDEEELALDDVDLGDMSDLDDSDDATDDELDLDDLDLGDDDSNKKGKGDKDDDALDLDDIGFEESENPDIDPELDDENLVDISGGKELDDTPEGVTPMDLEFGNMESPVDNVDDLRNR